MIKIKPYLRWLGGKFSVIDKIIENLPSSKIDILIEPFVGSGMVFANLKANNIVNYGLLNDNNKWIMKTHELTRDNPDFFIHTAEKYQNLIAKIDQNKEKFKSVYYEIRNKFNQNLNDCSAQQIMRFVWISKMEFNGLIRFNKNGLCTTASGHNKLKFVFDKENFIEISKLFGSAKFFNLDFTNFLDKIENKITKNSFIFYDPPYLPTDFDINKKDMNFNDYSEIPFNFTHIEKIKEKFDYFNDRGISQMLTINCDPIIEMLFKKYNLNKIEVSKFKPGTSGFRGKTYEYFITNF